MKIALITPLKDEINNIARFLKSVSDQTIEIHCLVIVENDSTDGSIAYLDQIKHVENVKHFEVINLTFEDKSYDLGFKYSKVVSDGFDHLKSLEGYEELDYLGILDCDCFPEPDYFKKLVDFMEANPEVGISSGLIFTDEGKPHIANPNWVRGGCRLWRKACFDDTGFPVEPSPDAITVALAHIHGWKAKTLKTAKVISREVNVRMSNFKIQGERTHYRGNSFIYALLKGLNYAFRKKRPKVGWDYFIGYTESMLKNKPRIKDKRIIKYYKYYLTNKIFNV